MNLLSSSSLPSWFALSRVTVSFGSKEGLHRAVVDVAGTDRPSEVSSSTTRRRVAGT